MTANSAGSSYRKIETMRGCVDPAVVVGTGCVAIDKVRCGQGAGRPAVALSNVALWNVPSVCLHVVLF